jgi:hypothetical protein
MRPPSRIHLPSGRVVALQPRDATSGVTSPRARARAAPLFSELLDLLASGDVALVDPAERGGVVDVAKLPLRDFHVLRAVATRLGWLAEEPIEIVCRNCAEPIVLSPCASLELGPFAHGELDDDELDAPFDFSAAHPIEPIGPAREAKLRDVSVGEAAPLHRALRRRRLAITDHFVRAMGIESLGPERDPRRIAAALARCTEEAWTSMGDLFLQAHYSARLCAVALCPKCGARNDVDAPYEREFDPSNPAALGAASAASNGPSFPDFDAFDASARALFERCAGDPSFGPPLTQSVRLIVDGGVPACDDGGEPLLGAYVPPGGDPSAPVGAAEITLYYRTFRAVWDEEGPYDWEGEVRETVEHELEHHAGWRVGHDPMDDDERDEIARERVRRIGRTQTVHGGLAALGSDVADFIARTWPIWLIVAAATVAIIAYGR